MVIVSLVGTVLVLVVVNAVVWNANGYGVAAIVSLVGLLFSILACAGGILLPPVSITALLLIIVSSVCTARKSTVGRFRICTICAGIIGMVAGFVFSLPYINHLHQLRDAYPMASLAERLSYETKAINHTESRATPATPTRFAPPPKGSPAWDTLALQEHESSFGSGRRAWALRQIHASTVEQFVQAPGFGVGRMSSVSDYWLNERRRPPEPLTAPVDDASPTTPSGPLLTARHPFDNGQSWLGLSDQLLSVHRGGSGDFLNTESFGLVIDRNHVAGFESHRFSNEFLSNLMWSASDDSSHLELARLELVSLLKFETPRVYVSNRNLPQLDQRHDAPTRDLTPFESAALALVEKGEDLVFNEHTRQVLAFGSLRAQSQCLKCHEVERGALLGAFSYQFHREAPPSRPNRPSPARPDLHGNRVAPAPVYH